MKEQFVTYEIALKLKKIGFDEPCLAYWKDNKIIIYSPNDKITQKVVFDNYKGIKSPLYSQAIDWFREKHGIDIIIRPFTGDIVGEKTYASDIYISKTNTSIKLKREASYHEAREQAILKCIELCQK